MKKQPNSRFCFLCGMENEQGLQLSWYTDDANTRVQTEVVIPDHMNGYPGINDAVIEARGDGNGATVNRKSAIYRS
ncbi:MAG: hypothetical protein U9N81_10485 [Bacillota bacterium]|nr:hypothetical protein [Bacillota bacterium]